jgi:hypothetical protein
MEILISIVFGMFGGALYNFAFPRIYRRFRKPEDRNAGLSRYQEWKDRK